MADSSVTTGRVWIVGAGPGDPGLITLRGVECLRRADLVLYDYLANPQLLDHAADAERVCLGRHGQGRMLSQDEVNRRMIDAARAGRSVVRLKGGDPAVFARVGEEVEALTAAGVPFEIVPGITTALAAGSHAGIPLTMRGLASAVALVTGHEQDEVAAPSLDYAALAAFPGTLVFYMGVTQAEHWSRALLEAGKPADTPTAIIRRCSWPDQQTFRCTLGTLADEIAQRKLRPPVIVIVGDVVNAPTYAEWFASRPLFGRRVLVTRPAGQIDALRNRLQDLGASVLVQPAIEIGPPADWSAVDSALERLSDFDVLVFSSANGVRYLLDRLLATNGDVRRLSHLRLATIGPGTAEALADYRLKSDLTPPEYRAESLADALVRQAWGSRLLLARASRGREVLAERLEAGGAHIEQVVVYESRDVAEPDPDVAEALAAGRIDFVTVSSSAIARSLAAMFGPALNKARLVSISPITSATLRELGFEPALEATTYTLDGLVEAIQTASS